MDGPAFPRFHAPPEGGVTAWYTQALVALGEGRELPESLDAGASLARHDARDAARVAPWNERFAGAA